MEFSATGNNQECNHLEVPLQISVSIQPNFWEDFDEASLLVLWFTHQPPWKETDIATTLCFKTSISLERNVGSSGPPRFLEKLILLQVAEEPDYRLRLIYQLPQVGLGVWGLSIPNIWEISQTNIYLGSVFYKPKFQSKHQPTEPNQPNPKISSLTKPKQTKDPTPKPSPLPQKSLARWKF